MPNAKMDKGDGWFILFFNKTVVLLPKIIQAIFTWDINFELLEF